MMIFIAIAVLDGDLGASQQIVQQLWLGSSFWAVGCASGAGLRAIGQRLRGR